MFPVDTDRSPNVDAKNSYDHLSTRQETSNFGNFCCGIGGFFSSRCISRIVSCGIVGAVASCFFSYQNKQNPGIKEDGLDFATGAVIGCATGAFYQLLVECEMHFREKNVKEKKSVSMDRLRTTCMMAASKNPTDVLISGFASSFINSLIDRQAVPAALINSMIGMGCGGLMFAYRRLGISDLMNMDSHQSSVNAHLEDHIEAENENDHIDPNQLNVLNLLSNDDGLS